MASTFRQYWDLTKPRVVALIVFTAIVGMFLAIDGLPDGAELLRGALGFLGIWLAASSAAAINQLLDARIDAKMARTSWRPLVQGQVKPWQALVFALVLAALSMTVLALALRLFRTPGMRSWSLTLVVLIVAQVTLGILNVKLNLPLPVAVAHNAGAVLLLWMAWRATNLPIHLAEAPKLRRWLVAGLVVLGVQIALGGWTSANYAALACGTDFPTCVGRWWPPTDFSEGFVLWRGIGVDYEGGVLDGASRIAIQMAHRMMAVVALGYLLWLAMRLFRLPGMRPWSAGLGLLALLQVALGVLNVKLALPLAVAVLHNAGALALLFVLVTLLARLKEPEPLA